MSTESNDPPSHRPLTPTDLGAGTHLARLGKTISALPQVDSTNSYLLQRAEIYGDGAIASAEYQTAGRGRLGRPWVAPRGSSILLSVLLIEPDTSLHGAYATMIAAVAACQAVETGSPVRPQIRWPNDLAIGGRKLGGVLAEAAPFANRPGHRAIVIGIGINCLQHRGHFPPELIEHATSLELASKSPIDRAKVAGELVRCLDFWTSQRPLDTSALAEAWRSRCGDLGARVSLSQDGQTFTGTVVEITDGGDLIVQLDTGGRRHFVAATTTRAW